MNVLRRLNLSGALMALTLAVAGCGEELGPEKMERTRVTGVVSVGGRPVGRGWVEFVPAGGTVGVRRSAPLRPDGSFVADGVAVGVNRVGIAGEPFPLPGSRHQFDPLGSPILRTIKKDQTEPLTIDLLNELGVHMPTRTSGQGR